MTEDIMEVLEKKFTSSNDISVTRAAITREEYEHLVKYVDALKTVIEIYKPN